MVIREDGEADGIAVKSSVSRIEQKPSDGPLNLSERLPFLAASQASSIRYKGQKSHLFVQA
jgi:hypothetical protein